MIVSGVDNSFKFDSVAVLENNFCYFVFFSVQLSNASKKSKLWFLLSSVQIQEC